MTLGQCNKRVACRKNPNQTCRCVLASGHRSWHRSYAIPECQCGHYSWT